MTGRFKKDQLVGQPPPVEGARVESSNKKEGKEGKRKEERRLAIYGGHPGKGLGKKGPKIMHYLDNRGKKKGTSKTRTETGAKEGEKNLKKKEHGAADRKRGEERGRSKSPFLIR